MCTIHQKTRNFVGDTAGNGPAAKLRTAGRPGPARGKGGPWRGGPSRRRRSQLPRAPNFFLRKAMLRSVIRLSSRRKKTPTSWKKNNSSRNFSRPRRGAARKKTKMKRIDEPSRWVHGLRRHLCKRVLVQFSELLHAVDRATRH